MPRNTRKNRRSTRRRARTRKAKRTTATINRALQPVAQRYICKMKYAEQITTSGLGAYAFNLNSIFDPNRSGVGHQPYGFDTLSTMYNRYRVIAVGWRCTMPAATDGVNQFLAAFPANEVVTFTDLGACIENPRVKYIEQGTAGSEIRRLTGKSYLPSLVGRTRAQYMADDRYQADVTSSPLELAVLNLFTSAANGVPRPSSVNILLEYVVEFFDIKHLPQS